MKPPISYYGGKQKMLRHILPLIPAHDLYCEPFTGGAAVFWAKEPAPVEVLNDCNNEIVNFYRVLAQQPQELADMVEGSLHSRALYDFAAIVYRYPEYFDPVRRAWAVWVQCNMSFSSIINGSFGYSKSASSNDTDIVTHKTANKRDQLASAEYLTQLRDRLRHVQVERRDAIEVIQGRDSSNAFFYVDPPYPESCQGHYHGYRMEDFVRLLDTLADIQGKFLLSCYDYPLLEDYAARHDWQILRIEQVLSAAKVSNKAGQQRKRKVECLVSNYPLFDSAGQVAALAKQRVSR